MLNVDSSMSSRIRCSRTSNGHSSQILLSMDPKVHTSHTEQDWHSLGVELVEAGLFWVARPTRNPTLKQSTPPSNQMSLPWCESRVRSSDTYLKSGT